MIWLGIIFHPARPARLDCDWLLVRTPGVQWLPDARCGFRSGGASGGGVAYWAHIGGFLAGVLLIKIFTAGRQRLAGYGYRPAPR